MIKWTIIIDKNLDPLSVHFKKTTLENDTIILTYLSTLLQKINIFDFSIFAIFHFRIPVSILSSFHPLAGFDLAFRYRLATSVQCLISAIFRAKMIRSSALVFGIG